MAGDANRRLAGQEKDSKNGQGEDHFDEGKAKG
jgi:hypothetical protein